MKSLRPLAAALALVATVFVAGNSPVAAAPPTGGIDELPFVISEQTGALSATGWVDLPGFNGQVGIAATKDGQDLGIVGYSNPGSGVRDFIVQVNGSASSAAAQGDYCFFGLNGSERGALGCIIYRWQGVINGTVSGLPIDASDRLYIDGTVRLLGFCNPVGVRVKVNGVTKGTSYSTSGCGWRSFHALASVAPYSESGQVCAYGLIGTTETHIGCVYFAKPNVTGSVTGWHVGGDGWLYLDGTVDLVGFTNRIGMTTTVNGAFTPYQSFSSAGTGPRAFSALAAKIPADHHGKTFCAYGENSGARTQIGCIVYP